jgi:hypothetical protein
MDKMEERHERLNAEAEQLRGHTQAAFPDAQTLRWEHSSAPPAPRELGPGEMAFRVGNCTVRVHLAGPVIRAEWSPAMPKHLTKRDWKQYRAGRDAFAHHLARMIGKPGVSVTVEM